VLGCKGSGDGSEVWVATDGLINGVVIATDGLINFSVI
jgi:hypothetical protein